MSSIIDLENTIKLLRPADRELFHNILDIHTSEGHLSVPQTFENKAVSYFVRKDPDGNRTESDQDVLNRLRNQKVVRTFNKLSGEGALFNWLRAFPPGSKLPEINSNRLNSHIEASKSDCDFCQPNSLTAEDSFGRISGKHCTIAANIAKYDAWHSIICFHKHNPLDFTQEELSDYLETGFRWFEKVHQENPDFRFPFLMWNCLEKAGASLIHGHAQILMSRDTHYAKTEHIRQVAENYREKFNRDYFNDLFQAHHLVNLAFSDQDTTIIANLTPIKEKEVIIVSRQSPAENESAKRAIYRTLRCFIDELGVTSFNLSISIPPPGEKSIPHVIRLVDRGNVFKTTADIGCMELYASSVIASDPYMVINKLRTYYSKF
jgi:hypothetical protein